MQTVRCANVVKHIAENRRRSAESRRGRVSPRLRRRHAASAALGGPPHLLRDESSGLPGQTVSPRNAQRGKSTAGAVSAQIWHAVFVSPWFVNPCSMIPCSTSSAVGETPGLSLRNDVAMPARYPPRSTSGDRAAANDSAPCRPTMAGAPCRPLISAPCRSRACDDSAEALTQHKKLIRDLSPLTAGRQSLALGLPTTGQARGIPGRRQTRHSSKPAFVQIRHSQQPLPPILSQTWRTTARPPGHRRTGPTLASVRCAARRPDGADPRPFSDRPVALSPCRMNRDKAHALR